MNKYFSKAVFYAEKKNILSAMLAYAGFYCWSIFVYVSDLNRAIKYHHVVPPNPSHTIDFLFFCFIAIAITTIAYSYMEKDKKYYFMLTQPYSRDSIIITKTVSFVISYIIPTIIYCIIIFAILFVNRKYYLAAPVSVNWYNTVISQFSLRLFACISILTLSIVLLQLMQMFFGKMISGIIMPIILYITFCSSLGIMGAFISRNFGYLKDLFKYVFFFLFSVNEIHTNTTTFNSLPLALIDHITTSRLMFSFILILISVVIFFISMLLNRKIKAENTSDIFLFKSTEKVFKVIFSLFITLVLSLMFSGALYYLYSSIVGMPTSTYLMNKYGIAGKESIEHNIYLVLNILWIPLSVLVYKLLSKLMNKRRAA